MVLRFYYDIMSQPSRALLLFIRINSIPCQEITIVLRKGEHHTDEYEAITPFKKVPVIEHDGFILTESVAILKYLCRVFTTQVPCHWYPIHDSKSMAKIDEYMSWQHLNLRTYVSMYFHSVIIAPMLSGGQVNEKRVEHFKNGLINILNQIENIWLKNNKYIAGNNLTIADLLAVTELEQAGMAGFDVKAGRPLVTTYMELVGSCLQPQYDEIHSKAREMCRVLIVHMNSSKL